MLLCMLAGLQVVYLLRSHNVTVVKDVHDVSLSHMYTVTKLETCPSLIASAAWTRTSSAQASDDVSVPVLSSVVVTVLLLA
jgi:hypothetical protein